MQTVIANAPVLVPVCRVHRSVFELSSNLYLHPPSRGEDNHDATPAETTPCSTSLKADFLPPRRLKPSFLSIFIILIPDGPAQASYSLLSSRYSRDKRTGATNKRSWFIPAECRLVALLSFLFFTLYFSLLFPSVVRCKSLRARARMYPSYEMDLFTSRSDSFPTGAS